jgi:hypothetical protein
VKGKITLITPPDIFENSNKSILLIHMSDEEQYFISKWLATHDVPEDLNLYVYSSEANIVWFLYALNRCEYKYINIDCVNIITQALSGYILSRNGVYYKTEDVNLSGIYDHINSNRVTHIEHFLESVLTSAKTSEPQL